MDKILLIVIPSDVDTTPLPEWGLWVLTILLIVGIMYPIVVMRNRK